MTRRDHMDRAFAAGLEDVFATRVDRSQRPAVGLSPRWQAAVAVVVAALVIAASAIVLIGRASQSPPADGSVPAPSITVSGRALIDVGTAAWADAVWLDAAHTTLVVHPDLDAVRALPGAWTCDADVARAHVDIRGSTVAITADVYDEPPVPGIDACAGVGEGAPPVTVHLVRAVVGSSVVDGTTGTIHRVLDPASIPAPAFLPAEFLERATTWNERSGAATRTWATDTRQKGSYVDYTVTRFRAGALIGRNGELVGRIRVHGHPAAVLVRPDSYEWTAVVLWTARAGQQVALESHGNLHHHESIEEIEHVAQSTPDP